jgi:D-glycerate 3-kinase
VSDRSLEQTVSALIQQEGLPDSYAETVDKTILPLADRICALHDTEKQPIVVGIHGAQGTGKSTLTLFLREILLRHRNRSTANFSLDDIYLTRAEREDLAKRVHPLFKTRGVPGTHDVALGQQVLHRLRSAAPEEATPIPAFDKSRDDRAPREQWPVFGGRAEIILLEGWCLDARPEKDSALAEPMNRLEENEDPDGIWRSYVNDQLKGEYRQFFDEIDFLVMLKAPSMECVLEWRRLQEQKLAKKIRNAPKSGEPHGNAQDLRIMTDDEVGRFVMHYERVTRACLAEMPGRADVLINVAEDHSLGLPQFREA